jgi:hypothetical protein
VPSRITDTTAGTQNAQIWVTLALIRIGPRSHADQAGVCAFSLAVPVTQHHTGDPHHLEADLRSSPLDMLELTRDMRQMSTFAIRAVMYKYTALVAWPAGL